jgi:hypothetical protein
VEEDAAPAAETRDLRLGRLGQRRPSDTTVGLHVQRCYKRRSGRGVCRVTGFLQRFLAHLPGGPRHDRICRQGDAGINATVSGERQARTEIAACAGKPDADFVSPPGRRDSNRGQDGQSGERGDAERLLLKIDRAFRRPTPLDWFFEQRCSAAPCRTRRMMRACCSEAQGETVVGSSGMLADRQQAASIVPAPAIAPSPCPIPAADGPIT